MRFKKAIAALSAALLIGVGITVAASSAQASVPGDAWAMPAFNPLELSQMRETITVDGTPTFEERFNEYNNGGGGSAGVTTTVDPALSTQPELHAGSRVQIDYLVQVAPDEFSGLGDSFYQPTGVEWNPFNAPANWLTAEAPSPTCADLPTAINNGSVIQFDCEATFVVPNNLADNSTIAFPALALLLKGTPTLTDADAASGSLTAPIEVRGFSGYSNWTYLAAPDTTPPVTPPATSITITPAPVNIEINAGDPLTVQTGDLTEGATYSDGSTGTPDIATIVTVPTGATSDPNALFDFTTETPGTYPFTYSLADDSTTPEATSAVVTGTIQVDPIDQILGVPQTYNIAVGDTLNLTAAELSTGATNSLDGSAVGSDIVVFQTPVPDGATVTELDNGESLTFVATTPGTFHVSYNLSYLAKTPDASDVITSTINVTSPPVHLPTVTG